MAKKRIRTASSSARQRDRRRALQGKDLRARKKSPSGTDRKLPKNRVTLRLSEELFERARDAVVFFAGPPEHLTLSQLAEQALVREIIRLEKKYVDGRRVPPRGNRSLRTGRPVKRGA